MDTNWIALKSIPDTGKTLTLDAPSLWDALFKEFGLSYGIIEPIHAEVFVLPQDQGVLFRGFVIGVLSLPCDRCSEESTLAIDEHFDNFELYPHDPLADVKITSKTPVDDDDDDISALDEVDEAVIRIAANARGIEINPVALVWEELSLALPVKPLCRDDCKGLCPVCGANKNSEPCSCSTDVGDPRLSVLRGLKITK